eukprot:TRINITY_DN4596_c0_g1_i1.p1 TRINITY_DN4596_c0_g1~~TRINITY_DN4596_c0_g1_i1.p1  ORF type:complete len:699 (-),score=18.43 TRINITY_DN4596_c0_g1_i1:191-1987(-)
MDVCTDNKRWGAWSHKGEKVRAVATCWKDSVIESVALVSGSMEVENLYSATCGIGYEVADCRCYSEDAACAGTELVDLTKRICRVERDGKFTASLDNSTYDFPQGSINVSAVCVKMRMRESEYMLHATMGMLGTKSRTECPLGYALLGCQCYGQTHACGGSKIRNAFECTAKSRCDDTKALAMAICMNINLTFQQKLVDHNTLIRANETHILPGSLDGIEVSKQRPDRGSVSATCPAGYVITGCRCYTPHACCDGGKMQENTCTVRNDMQQCTDENQWGVWFQDGAAVTAVATCWKLSIIESSKVVESQEMEGVLATAGCPDDYRLSDCRCYSQQSACAGVNTVDIDKQMCNVASIEQFQERVYWIDSDGHKKEHTSGFDPGYVVASAVCIKPRAQHFAFAAGSSDPSQVIGGARTKVDCPPDAALLGCQCTGEKHSCDGSPPGTSMQSCSAQNRWFGHGVRSIAICMSTNPSAHSDPSKDMSEDAITGVVGCQDTEVTPLATYQPTPPPTPIPDVTNETNQSNATNGTNEANGTNGTPLATYQPTPPPTPIPDVTNETNQSNATNGTNETNGTNGTNGTNETNGTNWTNGTNGTNAT